MIVATKNITRAGCQFLIAERVWH